MKYSIPVLVFFSALILMGCRKEVNDLTTVDQAQHFLTGDWKVSVQPTYNGYWEAELNVDSTGYYTANVLWGSTDEFVDNGVDTFAFPERKIVLQELNSSGYASGYINFMHYGGSMMTYEIDDLLFSEDRNAVEFWLSFNGYSKIIRYWMIRQ